MLKVMLNLNKYNLIKISMPLQDSPDSQKLKTLGSHPLVIWLNVFITTCEDIGSLSQYVCGC